MFPSRYVPLWSRIFTKKSSFSINLRHMSTKYPHLRIPPELRSSVLLIMLLSSLSICVSDPFSSLNFRSCLPLVGSRFRRLNVVLCMLKTPLTYLFTNTCNCRLQLSILRVVFQVSQTYKRSDLMLKLNNIFFVRTEITEDLIFFSWKWRLAFHIRCCTTIFDDLTGLKLECVSFFMS